MIENRVAKSVLVDFHLEDYYDKAERVLYDIKENLFQGFALKEKDFRAFLKDHDWSKFEGKNVAVTCSADAVVPTWAYMLLATKLQPYAKNIAFGSLAELENSLFQKALATVPIQEFEDKKVVVKGCGQLPVPTFAYVEISRLLLPVVSSLMFGEACSTVPIYKKPKVK